MQLFFRVTSYSLIFAGYLIFMNLYAPLGIGWLDWHGQRIFNATEFLKINGYLSSYGYSIWDTCNNCSLEYSNWKDKIYFSVHGISMIPYILPNHFGGKELLFVVGPVIDKLAIFACAAFIAELLIRSVKIQSHLPIFFVGSACFALFIISPWAYKMFLAPWFEVYFLLFFLLGMLNFQRNFTYLGYLSFFCAGLFHLQWALAIIIFYTLVIFAHRIYKREFEMMKYFPSDEGSSNHSTRTIFALLVPVLVIIFIRLLAQQYAAEGAGSSIFYRIGISGNDIHNGGLIGALQFLGGNRITHCVGDMGMQSLSGDLAIRIAIFNCALSIFGMAIISILSIIGAYFLMKISSIATSIFLPLIFSLLIFIAVLQQSLSVHLMGYSFIFSMIFAVGITNLMILLHNRFGSSVIGFIFSIPCLLGILLLSIRVSFLTGANG